MRKLDTHAGWHSQAALSSGHSKAALTSSSREGVLNPDTLAGATGLPDACRSSRSITARLDPALVPALSLAERSKPRGFPGALGSLERSWVLVESLR